jgi:hypothetical protein
MLASITPLGERSRGFSWRVTATAFALGAVSAGAAGGAALGACGTLIPLSATPRAAVLLFVLAATLPFELGSLRGRLPTTRRQVNEDWMARYRGWVYGVAFGVQLGVGLMTIVTCAAIYAAAAAALLCGSAAGGAAIGGSFGVVRALGLLPAGSVKDPEGLRALHRRFARGGRLVHRATPIVEVALIALVLWWMR